MAPPLPLWWLMCSARAGPMPFGAAWWVEPCAKTALLGGGAVPPQGRPLRGRGPAWGFLCHPGGLCRGPWNFCGRRGLVAQETAPLGHQGAPAKSPFCQAWGVGCQCTRCVATAGVGTPWSTASATQVAYLGAALRPGGGLWAAAPVPATAGAGWAAAWARWGLGGWRKGHDKGQQGCIGQPWWASVSHPGGTKCLEFFRAPACCPLLPKRLPKTTQLCGTKAFNWPWACVCQKQAPSV